MNAYVEKSLPIDEVYPLRDALEVVRLQTSAVFPKGRSSGSDFCQTHFEEKLKVNQEIEKLKLILNLSEIERRDEQYGEGREIVESLLNLLDGTTAGRDREDFATLFMKLPIQFRYEVIKVSGRTSSEIEDNFKRYFHLTDRLAVHRNGTELFGILYQQHHRLNEQVEKELSDLPNEKRMEREILLDALNAGISEQLVALACDSVGARRAIEDALDTYERLIPEGFERRAAPVVVQLPPALPSLEEVIEGFRGRPAKSFDQLQRLILEVRGMERFGSAEKGRLAETVLEAAAKGGLDLNAGKGFYYWIWWLAHEKDSRAGGDNFGKVQAPKDLDRLLQAIERVLPAAEVVLAGISRLEIASLQRLRGEVVEVCAMERFGPQEKEKMFSVLLESALKGKVSLDGPKGVYYWIWFLAHEKDPKAGGDNFGRIQAPKDAQRLLEAIDRALQG